MGKTATERKHGKGNNKNRTKHYQCDIGTKKATFKIPTIHLADLHYDVKLLQNECQSLKGHYEKMTLWRKFNSLCYTHAAQEQLDTHHFEHVECYCIYKQAPVVQ